MSSIVEKGEDMAKGAMVIVAGGIALYVGYGLWKCYQKHHSLNPIALFWCAASSSGGILKDIGKSGLRDAKKVGQFIGKTGKGLTHKLGRVAKNDFRKIKHIF